MVLVAQIIVDVPLMQTDRPYSYLIPEAMQGQIAIGMRVHAVSYTHLTLPTNREV